MKICLKCVLPETFPGIKFNQDGICQYCETFKPLSELNNLKERYQKKFNELINELKSKGVYDVLMAFSGGKDSSFTLKILTKNFDLKVLAITFNNGFISEQALKNIQAVTETLQVDHLLMSPHFNVLANAFRQSINARIYPVKALERASSVCNTCMNLVKSFLLKSAIEMRVPFIAYGWSPGQAPIQSSVLRLNKSMIQQIQKTIKKILQGIMGDDLKAYLLQEYHFNLISTGITNGQFYNIHPLAFLEYDEEKILKEIKTLGWKDPKDTDANSTNCLLNGFANQVHQKQLGFHPYAFEIAGLVRNGHLTREQGLKKLSAPPDENVIKYVKQRLEIC